MTRLSQEVKRWLLDIKHHQTTPIAIWSRQVLFYNQRGRRGCGALADVRAQGSAMHNQERRVVGERDKHPATLVTVLFVAATITMSHWQTDDRVVAHAIESNSRWGLRPEDLTCDWSTSADADIHHKLQDGQEGQAKPINHHAKCRRAVRQSRLDRHAGARQSPTRPQGSEDKCNETVKVEHWNQLKDLLREKEQALELAAKQIICRSFSVVCNGTEFSDTLAKDNEANFLAELGAAPTRPTRANQGSIVQPTRKFGRQAPDLWIRCRHNMPKNSIVRCEEHVCKNRHHSGVKLDNASAALKTLIVYVRT